MENFFDDIDQKGWSVIPNFLNQKKMIEINTFFDEHLSEFKAAKVGGNNDQQRIEAIRGDYTFWLDSLSPPEGFQDIFNFLETLKDQLNQRFYLGIKQYECHLARFPEGTFYKRHLDRFEKDSSRVFSFIFYLNQSAGGDLILYDKNGKVLDTIVPIAGTFVGFMSEDFPHEVRLTQKERRSLTGWMHSKIIY